MNKVIKLNSLQSGSFSSSKNLLDFELPARQLDLEKSYVNLVASTTFTDVSASTGVGVYNYAIKWDNTEVSVPNSALVKNCRLTSDKVPILEDIRRVDALRTQLYQYTESEDDKRGDKYRQLFQTRENGNIKLAPGIEFFGEGSTKSIVHDTNIQIPMKDIFELGKMKKYPGDKLGKSRVHLEMNFDKLTVHQLQGAGSRLADTGNQFIEQEYCNMQNFPVNVGDIGTSANPFFMSATVFTRQGVVQHPYWVGQKLTFTGTKRTSGTPTGTVSVEGLITNIELLQSGPNAGKLAITFSERLTNLGADEDCIDIFCDGVDAGSINFTILQAEIVLEEVAPSQYEKMDQLQYSTFTNEGDNGAGIVEFTRLYSCEPEAFNLFALPLTKADILPAQAEIGATNRFKSWRISIDNEYTTNRNVEYATPLYRDEINKTFLNANLPLKDLTEVNQSVSSRYLSVDTAGSHKTLFIGTPMPMTPRRKQVQLQITGEAGEGGMGKLELYKQVVRMVDL